MIDNHWETTALPILEYCVSRVIDYDDPPGLDGIVKACDLDQKAVQTALKLLAYEDYIKIASSMNGPVGVIKVNPSGLRAVGQWPSSNNEVFGNAMIEALEKLANEQQDEAKSQALRAAASDVRAIGVNGAGQVLGSFVKGLIGLS